MICAKARTERLRKSPQKTDGASIGFLRAFSPGNSPEAYAHSGCFRRILLIKKCILAHIQLIIFALFLHQLVMGSLFQDIALVNVHDAA